MADNIGMEILYFFFVCFAVDTNSNLLTDLCLVQKKASLESYRVLKMSSSASHYISVGFASGTISFQSLILFRKFGTMEDVEFVVPSCGVWIREAAILCTASVFEL